MWSRCQISDNVDRKIFLADNRTYSYVKKNVIFSLLVRPLNVHWNVVYCLHSVDWLFEKTAIFKMHPFSAVYIDMKLATHHHITECDSVSKLSERNVFVYYCCMVQTNKK